MQRLMLTSIVLLAWVSGEAMGACGTPYMSEKDVKDLLIGNTICSPANCTGASCSWQEQHRGIKTDPGVPASGELWDYKGGDKSATDKTSQVGSWNITGAGGIIKSGKVTHTYGSKSYVYDVKNNGSSYSFCGPNGEFPFSKKDGQVGC